MLLATLALSISPSGAPLAAVTIHKRAAYVVVFPSGEPGGVTVVDAQTVEEAFTLARAAFDNLMLEQMRDMRREFHEVGSPGATSAERIAANQKRERRLVKIGGVAWARQVMFGGAS